MKANQNKYNDNIDIVSRNSLNDLRRNQINTNIKIHIAVIIIIALINVFFIFFIIFLQKKIVQIKDVSSSHQSEILKQDTQVKSIRSFINKEMVNIFGLGTFLTFGIKRFSFILEKEEEFLRVKSLIYDFLEQQQYRTRFIQIVTSFCYQGTTDSDDFSSFIKRIRRNMNLVILIHTEDNKKFGIFHREPVIPIDEDNKYFSNSTDMFIFTFDIYKRYKAIGHISLEFNEDKLITINDELIIYNNYFEKGGYINFPLKSFDFQNVTSNILTGKNGKFNIKDIEAFTFV